MVYNVAIFFDNLKSHVSGISKICNGRITSVYVGGNEDIEIVPFTDEHFRRFWERREFAKNTYLQYIHTVMPDGDMYDPSSGIKEKDFNEFIRWLEETNKRGERAIFLDWDRTITIFEGIGMKYTSDKDVQFSDLFPGVFIEDMLLYLCGGEKRLAMLRNMLRTAQREGVDIYILTNNTACSYRFFKEIVDGVMGSDVLKIVCAGDEPYNGNKVKAIRNFMRRQRSKISLRRTMNNQINGGAKASSTRRRKMCRKY